MIILVSYTLYLSLVQTILNYVQTIASMDYFYEQYINIEITVNAFGTVVNMLFIKHTIFVIEINMYMNIFLSPFLSFCFFLSW